MVVKVNPADLTRSQLLSLVDKAYPGDFTGYSKAELLGYAAAHPSSKFETLLTSSNVLAQVEKNRVAARDAKKKTSEKDTPERRIAGKAIKDPQYDIEVEFGVRDGSSFSNPLDIESGTTYQCRMRLRQHQGEFNCTGFTLKWTLIGALSWADGHGTDTYEEAISNPLVISRLVTTGTVAPNAKTEVKVEVKERYL